ncbi:MAG: DegT/DnrJ/EryC1/StrS family aminotransferase [Muricauda sp.]|jgi:8-amino-3,8-dideoxy-alpha-D-manno-octulosonate transaminase|nr:DegT/DnrJ/EryC1/StrS family aminotransferase [Allomuricauda sp.]MBO6533349.1 DegT/DnrJ/EryC1/StrS family aminotransferase [Allomuricauda sp.]MBO6589173.1 DegT/DnrJ/EryC1/StrS family aminotransferase [Allomuricauda sp.]MBO6618798.1 DegT/DnrJ/EryC1/StrS family aminotransferase [Allomuricauda sp.]MBO6644711.1 DegT/DnrJ/EryC1/StrS family aminotransferase [Allomuricauda sp.]MBO6746611.1 DegT/DnrJ/EryC1/StrS family aminotransferase [Allomuricauda sp.]
MPGFELFGDKERMEVQNVLDSGVLMRYGFDAMRNGHWKALELEQGLAKRMQTQYAHAVSSGTAALTVALASAGIGAGDEVIMPTFTFVASFESILALGAVPVLVDIDDTLTLKPEAVEKAITPKTKVVMPVHMCGSMADLNALKAICEANDLLLLEDACQAIGGTYHGKPLGSIGDLGCFSFDYVKTITCGEGGALITNNKAYYENAHKYSDHGHDHIGNNRGAEEHPFLGYNFRISEMNAAVGVAQLARLDDFLAIQKRNYTLLREALSQIPEVVFRTVPEGGEENYSFLNFFMPSGELAQIAHQELIEAGVDGCFYWFDNNWHYYRKWEHLTDRKWLGKLPQDVVESLPDYSKADFSESDQWMSRNISCLIKLGWTEEEVKIRAKQMVDAIKAAL